LNPVADSLLPQLVEELTCSQEQLTTAISAADILKTTELLDEREPVWQQLKALLGIPGILAGSTRDVLEKLMQRENGLQEQLQQEMRVVDTQARKLGNRGRVLQRYRLPLKPLPRFLDRNG
jgi:hypothetical protein